MIVMEVMQFGSLNIFANLKTGLQINSMSLTNLIMIN